VRIDLNLAPAGPDDRNTLLVDSAAAIEKDAPLSRIEAALRPGSSRPRDHRGPLSGRAPHFLDKVMDPPDAFFRRRLA
jgi:hypothetical protein